MNNSRIFFYDRYKIEMFNFENYLNSDVFVGKMEPVNFKLACDISLNERI